MTQVVHPLPGHLKKWGHKLRVYPLLQAPLHHCFILILLQPYSHNFNLCSIQRALKCVRREIKLYLFTEVYYVTLHTSLVSFVCVWMFRSEINFNRFSLLRSMEQWTLCRDHINQNTVHAHSSLLMSWLSESGVLTERDMQNMQSRGREDWNWERVIHGEKTL